MLKEPENFTAQPFLRKSIILFSVSEENGSVTVTLSDERDQYVKYWAYFKTVCRFVFDRERGEYVAYAREQEGREEKLEENWFE